MGFEQLYKYYLGNLPQHGSAQKDHQELIARIMATPHEPTLKFLSKTDKGFLLKKVTKAGLVSLDKIAEVEMVADFDYTEEEIYVPVKALMQRAGLNLLSDAIDTKILRTLYPRLEFDAYRIHIGEGFDPIYTHNVGSLYKIQSIMEVK